MDSENLTPPGYCQCGCGERTNAAPYDDPDRGYTKGEPVRYRVGHARRRSLADRFWEKVEKTDTCWLWRASKSSNGYGRINLDDGEGIAHRVAYELAIGPIPEGHQIHHVCRVKDCVNPDHLKAVAPVDHAQEHLRTHCPRGHEYTPENTYLSVSSKTGWQSRLCRTCVRKRQRESDAARRIAIEPRACVTCEETYVPQRKNQKACCHECSRLYYAKAARERRAAT